MPLFNQSIIMVSEEYRLLKDLSEGSSEAFLEIYQVHHQRLFSFANKYLQDENLAEDAVHDTFLKLWEIKARVNPNLPIINYLYRIVRNFALKALKKKQEQESIKESSRFVGVAFERCVHTVYLEKENMSLFNQAVMNLSCQRRRVFKLCRQEGLTYREAATQLNISPYTIKEHMSLAMRFVQSYLKLNT